MNKYETIARYIANEIEMKRITAGKKLPAVRSMAAYFGCSKSTVIRAYDELEKEHKVYTARNKGYYSLGSRVEPAGNNGNLIDFTSVMPEGSLIPYRTFQHCLTEAMKMSGDLLSFPDPQGNEWLRKAIARQLQDSQIFADHRDIFILCGTQQAINILGSMPFPGGKDAILAEQPSYHGALQSFILSKKSVSGINRNYGGLDLDELERLLKKGNTRFFYTVPRYSNPLGLSMTNDEKKQLVKLARKYDTYIVEDDYIGDLETDSRKYPIRSYDEFSKVIYLKSFSKTFLPGIRMGMAIIPAELRKVFLEQKKWSDLHNAALMERALEIGISSGLYKDWCKMLTKSYQSKMSLVKKIWNAEHGGDSGNNIPDGGIFASMKLKDKISSGRILSSLEKKGILADDTSLCFLNGFSENAFIMLSIAGVTNEQISKAIPQVIHAI